MKYLNICKLSVPIYSNRVKWLYVVVLSMSSSDAFDQAEIAALRERIFNLDIGLGVVISLHINQSMNLKMIAKFVGARETTTLNQVKQLLQEGIIVLDSERTATSRGKFYMLPSRTKAALRATPLTADEELELLSLDQAKISQKLVEQIESGKFDKAFAQFKIVKNIYDVIESNFIRKLSDVMQDIQSHSDASTEDKQAFFTKHDLPLGGMSLALRSLRISNLQQFTKFFKLLDNFAQQLSELREEFDDATVAEDFEPYNQLVYTSIVPIVQDLDV